MQAVTVDKVQHRKERLVIFKEDWVCAGPARVTIDE